MPAVTIHGPRIATATPVTEACRAGRAGRSGACRAVVGVLSSGRTSWDTLVSVHSP